MMLRKTNIPLFTMSLISGAFVACGEGEKPSEEPRQEAPTVAQDSEGENEALHENDGYIEDFGVDQTQQVTFDIDGNGTACFVGGIVCTLYEQTYTAGVMRLSDAASPLDFSTSEEDVEDWFIYLDVVGGTADEELDFIRNPLCLNGSKIRRDDSDSACGGGDEIIVDVYTVSNTYDIQFDMDDMGDSSQNSTGITDLINSLSYENQDAMSFIQGCNLTRTVLVEIKDAASNTVDKGHFIVNLTEGPYGAFLGTNAVSYTENAVATSVIAGSDNIVLCAKDGTDTGLTDDLLSATITVTDAGGSQNSADTIAVTTSGGVTLGGSSTATNLLLTGTATESAYKAVFETLTFHSTEITPTGTPTTRTISLTITDTTGISSVFTKTITVNGVNDPPSLTGDKTATVNEGGTYVLTTSDLFYTDVDDDNTGVTFTASGLTNVSIEVNGSPSTTFTGTQISTGLVVVEHDGSETISASFNVSVEDGNEDASSPVAQAFTFAVTPQNDPPALSGDRVATFNEGESYILLTSDLFYTDVDDNNAGVTFTTSTLTNVSIEVNGTPSTTFTGTQLNAGQVVIVHDDSETTSASFNVSVEDGNEDSSTPTTLPVTFTITPQNDPPVITGDLTATFNEGASYILTTSDLFFTDSDDDNAGVTFTASTLVNITMEVNGSSSTTFTGTQLNAGQVVVIHDDSETIVASFNVIVEDGNEDGSSPTPSAVAFVIVPQNEAAVIGALGGTRTYTEDGGPIDLDSNATLTDDDGVYNEGSLNISVSGTDVTEDVITFSKSGIPSIFESGANVQCNEGSGAVTIGTLSGSDSNRTVTLASSGVTQPCAQALLQSAQFNISNTFEPAFDQRTVNYTYTGPDAIQTTGSVTVNVNVQNDAPVLSNIQFGTQWTVGMLEYTESDAATIIDADISLDDDATDFDGATLQVAIVNAVGSEDDLALSASLHTSISTITAGGVAGSNDTNVTFQFNGSATESAIINLLQGLKYDNTNDSSPDDTEREISIVFTDVGVLNSGSNSTYIKVIPVNDNPSITAFTNTPSFEEDTTTFVTVDGNVSVSDPDNPTDFDGGTLTVEVYKTTPGNNITEDRLDYNAAITIGTVTALDQEITVALSSSATPTQVENFIEGIGYKNTNTKNPDTTARTVKVTLEDGQGGSATATTNVTIIPKNDAPQFVDLGGSVAFTESQTSLAYLDSNVTVTDDDAVPFDGGSLAVEISANALGSEDNLAIDTSGSLSVSSTSVKYNGTTFATLSSGLTANDTSLNFTFNANATTTQVNELLQSLYYDNTNDDNPSTSSRTVSFAFNDIANLSETTTALGSVTVTVAGVDDNPVLTISDTPNYTEEAAAVQVAPTATLTDPDGTDFTSGSLTVDITSNLLSSEDVLAVGSFGGITVSNNQVLKDGTPIASWNTTQTGLSFFILPGANQTAVQALVRAITYENTNGDDPSILNRTVTFLYTDASSLPTGNINVTLGITPVNDKPVLANATDTVTYVENADPTLLFANVGITVTDVDSTTYNSRDNFNSGFVQAQLASTPDGSSEILSVKNNCTDAGEIDRVNSDIKYILNGVTSTIGTVASNDNGVGDKLKINLTSSATASIVSELLNCLTYENTSEDPTVNTRVITVKVNDGDGGVAETDPDATSSVSVEGQNDTPDIGYANGVLARTSQDNTTSSPLSQFTVSDEDSADTVTLTVFQYNDSGLQDSSRLNGRFTSASLGSFVDNSDGSYTISAVSPAVAQAAVRALVFDPTDNQVEVGQTVVSTFEILVVDSSLLTGESTTIDSRLSSASDSLSLTVTSMNDNPVLTPSTTSVNYSEGTATVAIGNIAITDADLNDDVTIALQIAAQNWPDDPNAPSLSDKDSQTASHPQTNNPPPAPIAVYDTYGADLVLTCGSSCANVSVTSDAANGHYEITGTPAAVTSALVGAYLEFHLADLALDSETDDRNSDYNFNQVSDFDLNTAIALNVTDETTGAATNTINLTAARNGDPPHAILTYETSCDPIAPGCLVDIFAGWSYDPDQNDSISEYRIYSDAPNGSQVICDGQQIGIDSQTPCVLQGSDEPIIQHTVPSNATGIAFRLEVEDGTGNSSVTTLDDLDIVNEGVPNQAAFVQIYFGDIDCSPMHATVPGGPFVDNDDDCFCDTSSCGSSSAVCKGLDGLSCNPNGSNCTQIPTATGINVAGSSRRVYTACGFDPDLTSLSYHWEISKTVGWSTSVIAVNPSAEAAATTSNTVDVSVSEEQDDACYCDSSTIDVTPLNGNPNGIPDCYFLSGAVCNPIDDNDDNVADAFQTVANPVSITPLNGAAAISGNIMASTRFVDSNQASIRVGRLDLSNSAGVTGDINIQVTAYDGEDAVSSAVTLTYCDGYFEDTDNDGYGDPDNYFVRCGISGSYYDEDGDTHGSVPAGYLSNNIGNLSGIDCSDNTDVEDDPNVINVVSSVYTSLPRASVKTPVHWYIDIDEDDYGAIGAGATLNPLRLSDDENGDGFIDDADRNGVDDLSPYPVVYGDLDGDGTPDDCYNVPPTDISRIAPDGDPDPNYGWWPQTGGYDYVLNNDDCNDTRSYTDSGGQLISAENQNPEMDWYVDFDEDGHGLEADGFATTALYLDGARDCYCDASCSNCTSKEWVTNGTSVEVNSLAGCAPSPNTPDGLSLPTRACYDFPVQLVQCEDPHYDGVDRGSHQDAFGVITPVNPKWTSANAADDCDEGLDHVHADSFEVCDANNIDEDCNGKADDDDSGVTNAIARYADTDNDGFTNVNVVDLSCDGPSSSSSINYQEIYFFVPSAAVDSLSIPQPTAVNQGLSGQNCVCPESTCTYGCRLRNDLSISCEADTRQSNLTCDEDNQTPYDPNGSEFKGSNSSAPITYFYKYAFDCNDSDDGVFPGANEECDGVLNDCNQICGDDPTACALYSSATPEEEIDLDNDTFVECDFQGGTWRGSSAPQVGSDCSPEDQNVFPYAVSVCDGQYNDCNLWSPKHSYHVDYDNDGVYSSFETNSPPGDCFCNADTCDPNGGDICLDSSGNSCEPKTYSLLAQYNAVTGFGCYCTDDSYSDCLTNQGAVCTPATPGDCYCPSSGCVIDPDSDGNSDCVDSQGNTCNPVDTNSDGIADVYDSTNPSGTATNQSINNVTYLGVCSGLQVLSECLPGEERFSGGAPDDQIDNDGDCYVECFSGNTQWAGSASLLEACNASTGLNPNGNRTKPISGLDCDDTNQSIYPTAAEICDGLYNNCNAAGWSATTPPSNEADNDSDGYVICPIDPSGWDGDQTVVGGEDCDDNNDTRYPSANEICDGQFNDCESDFLNGFAGVTGEDCYCSGTNTSSCVTAAGEACTPDVSHEANSTASSYIELSSPPNSAYPYQYVECFCLSDNCQIDEDGDGLTDCLHADRSRCQPLDANSDGFADTCITDNPTDLAQTFTAVSFYSSFNDGAPGREVDDDGDDYVECNYNSSIWNGSPFVTGGNDCFDDQDDLGNRVYPGATALCDGLFNDCNAGDFSLTAIPESEQDLDGDGWIACDPEDNAVANIPWSTEIAENPTRYIDIDEDCFCGGRDSNGDNLFDSPDTDNCVDGAGLECNPCANPADPAQDLDSTTCLDGLVQIGGFADCNDTDATVYPNALEYCDGQWNNCVDAENSTRDAPLVEIDNDGDGQVECRYYQVDTAGCTCSDYLRTDGTRDCVDLEGNQCTPLDADGDGEPELEAIPWAGEDAVTYADCQDTGTNAESKYFGAAEVCDAQFNDCSHGMISSNPMTGGNYRGVVSDCLCISADCTIDVDGDSVSDCVDTQGNTCTPEDSDGDNKADECAADLNDVGVVINNIAYKGAEADCYCATSNCLSDYNTDGVIDCYTSTGAICNETFTSDATAFESCVSDDADLQFLKNLGTKPFEEVDNDGDRYVECTEFDLTTWRNQGGSVLILGGSDCDDLDEDVYPAAVELCDGQLNACPTDPADYPTADLPVTEVDDDGDGFVDCTQDNGELWVNPETDPEGAAVHYVDADSCYCDGDCSDSATVCIDLTGAACTPDASTCTPIGGFGDCDDDASTGQWVFPNAPGLCDGRYNDCLDSDFSLTETPVDEVDGDGDGYVACSGFDAATWTGDSAVVGGDDCQDSGNAAETIYPGAPEQCDGLFNDCENLQQSAYEGVVGDCYCPAADCEIDFNGDGLSDCLDSQGNSCEPIDRDQDNFADSCAESLVAVSINGIDHYGVEADCYCPTSDCELESGLDSNSTLDCLTPEGLICSTQDDGFGFAEACAMGEFNHTFTGFNGAVLTAPMDEIDHDRDDYVECAFGQVAWQGSPSVIGGDDCYDYDELVYPAASIEYCDGQYNDCSDLLYNPALGHFENLAPPSETDDDGDGFVECEPQFNENWVNPDIQPNGFGDCNDTLTGALVYPYADEICDGQFNNCEDPSYNANTAPADETDNDADGYVECPDYDATTWGGDENVIGGSDCDDTLATGSTIYPNAPEACDGQFNNCDHPQQSDFQGVISDCFCIDSGCEIDPDGDGTANCVDASGATCSPEDDDQDGFADDCEPSLAAVTINGNDYFGIEVDCYCPTEDCQLDVVDDAFTFDCVTPDGYECPGTVAIDNGLGFAEDCASNLGATIEPHSFIQSNGLALTAPFFELDNDGDNYVECEYVAAGWEGSLNVQGGLDCDDADATVYPLAEEVCDGQYNDCDNGWVANGAPGDEVDNDNDGWVECTRATDVEWQPWNGAAEPNIVYGSDGSSPSVPYCVCSNTACTSGCVDEAGNDCIVTPGYCDPVVFTTRGDCDDTSNVVAPFIAEFEYSDGAFMNASLCMRDADFDGYGDSVVDPESDPEGLAAGHDCDDTNLVVHPQQDEVCEPINEEQVDSDCNGDVNTANSPYGLVNALQNLYRDADQDGFGDPSIEATPACEVAAGFVFNATDCDDNDPDTYPGAPEICDGTDQDCDLTIDEPESLAEPSISRCTYMYRDQDTDGYGDEDQSMCLCQQGSDPSVEEGGYTYIIYSGDCWDSSSEIKPLSCQDGIDNDNDGFPDELDVDCLNGYVEDAQGDWSAENKEEVTELLDGHDNNCDGFVAAIELDCDDDGTFPQVPADNFNLDRAGKFKRASDLGLEACDPNVEGGYELQCWGENLRLECDKLTADIVFGEGNDGEPTSTVSYNGTGLWMLNISESSDGFTGRFDGGYRKYPEGKTCTNSLEGDCDDHCSMRCPGQSEVCDGIDNNCNGVDIASDRDGIPDALDTDVAVPGMVSPAEMDIDLDGFLACDSFASNRTETQFSDKSCADDITIAEENDCNNFCFYTSPASEERCDGFLGVCGGEPEGFDEDRDDRMTCGAWSGEGSSMTEDVFAVVWLKDIDWSQQGSDEVELIRPNSDAPSPEDLALERTDGFDLPRARSEDTGVADSGLSDSGLSDSGLSDSGLAQGQEDDILPEFGESLPILNAGNGWVGGDVKIDDLQDMIPLIIPRFKAPDCDSELLDQLTLLLGEERVTRILDPGPEDNPSELILDACGKQGAAGCALVKISLSEDADSKTYETIDQSALEIPAFSPECEAKPEQWIARTVWQRERIVSSRETVVEWECQRIYGRDCDEVAPATPMKPNWMDTMVSAERWLLSDRVWWKELGRFNPEPIVFGTVMSCWGDPTDATSSISSETGGDCNDEVKRSHRDLAEGPGDLVGLYQNGELTDCATCLDGIDNNCDGAIDCADPSCARCFVGQGVGCGGGTESPCAQGGCSAPAPSGNQRMYNSIALFILSLCAVSYRRRKLK